MKKFFSLIALVGVFAACQPEQIETAFKVAGAKLTVNVSVVDLDGTEYSDATITSTAGTVSGKTITFEAAEATAIPAQTITVTATTPQLPKSYSQSVSIPEVIAGGVGTIDVRMVIGEKIDDYTYSAQLEEQGDPELVDVKFLENKHYTTYEHKHPHGDIVVENFFLNDSEYILTGTVDYQIITSAEVIAVEALYDDFQTVVEQIAEVFNVEEEREAGKLDFKVSAFGMWASWQKRYATESVYAVVAEKGNEKLTVGEFVVVDYNTTVAEEIELGMPVHVVGHGKEGHISEHQYTTHGHDEHGTPHVYTHDYTHEYYTDYPIYSHYWYGHGVAGGASNAGGGIVFAE
ncbi:MAG: DUF3869 domain-containing protein [Bacteroidales bacterium]|nr:DUF3869 domain-containing protein [Bacteroidales bacterium]